MIDIRIIISILFIASIIYIEKKAEGPYDFLSPMLLAATIICYLIFWVIWLVIKLTRGA